MRGDRIGPIMSVGMKLVINGENTSLPRPCTVRELLEQRGLGQAPCAVEVNARLVKKFDHSQHLLAEGDRVEIVTLVGGG